MTKNPTYRSFRGLYETSLDAIKTWGREPERWMSVEETGEFLETLGKLQRGRAHPDELAEEAADVILTAIQACACEEVPASTLFDAIRKKHARTRARLARAKGDGAP